MTYSSPYKQQKPLSSRLKVEQSLEPPTGVKQRKKINKPEPPPAYMKPVRTSGKSQGIEEGSSGEVKDYLASVGEDSPLTGWEAHALQMLANGSEDALDCFWLIVVLLRS